MLLSLNQSPVIDHCIVYDLTSLFNLSTNESQMRFQKALQNTKSFVQSAPYSDIVLKKESLLAEAKVYIYLDHLNECTSTCTILLSY